MKETIEFRIPEEHASAWLKPGDGKLVGGFIRKLELEKSDPRFQRVAEADQVLRKRGRAFFTSWDQRRSYSKNELDQAEYFQLLVTSIFEPAGEDCGTQYDESTACAECGSGATQVGPLFLPCNRIPKNKDISQTIAGEIVVSLRLVEKFNSNNVTGVEFEPVRCSSNRLGVFFQMKVASSKAEIVPPTRVGENPFDEDEQGRCPQGDLLGLNLLSELSIRKNTFEMNDVISSKQYIGARRGLLRPKNIIIISQKIRRLIQTENLKGCKVEIAHLI